MEQMIFSIVFFSMIVTIVQVGSVAEPGDVISGKEFLTILMTPPNVNAPLVKSTVTLQRQYQQHNPKPTDFRRSRKFRHFFYELPERDDGVLPIEALFTSHEDMSLSSTPFHENGRDQRQQPTITRGLKWQPSADSLGRITLNPSEQLESLRSNTQERPNNTSSVSFELTTTSATATSAAMVEFTSSEEYESMSTTPSPLEEITIEPEWNEVSPITITEGTIDEQSVTTEMIAHLSTSNVRNGKSADLIHALHVRSQVMLPVSSPKPHCTELSVEKSTSNREMKGSVEKESIPALVSDNVHNDNCRHSQFAPRGFSQQRLRMQRKQDTKGTFQSLIYLEKKEKLKNQSSISNVEERSPLVQSWRDISDEYVLTQMHSRSDSHALTAATAASSSKTDILRSMLRAVYSDPVRFYPEPAHYYSEPSKVYSEPAKVYGEPEKVYSQPARVYSEPAKVYSEPAKVYSIPAKVYSEPAKIYSQPSSYWQTAYTMTVSTTTKKISTSATATTNLSMVEVLLTTTIAPQVQQPAKTELKQNQRQRLVFNELDKIPYDQLNAPTVNRETQPIHNAIGKFVPKQITNSGDHQATYKFVGAADHTAEDSTFEAKIQEEQMTKSVVQTLPPVTGSDDESKVGYVVEGRNYRKYRVEEKTSDGFIVGEYGVLSHNDGNLRGVRYTADSDTNPRVIYDALLKFLSL